ncbi:restriction endonuclease [Companilactobacillus ginsenosidimutans]|uniref:Restriction endonuclease n=1 Tax=Companilactobacillus ginsenosidimutans TaxID=1007676 RepID=A0A0H4QJT9_9LACO|nr:restriction endonuclease [Companilactobacillus ginsenosidimutans]AKP66933.1 restriction endonuclease [Companilactobacillus ginsenosidimutans]
MNYKDLQIGKHGLPRWDAMIPSVLHYLSNGETVQGRKIAMDIADSLGLPPALRKANYENRQKANMIEDRINWAVSELYTSGSLNRPKRAMYTISKVGLELLKLDDSEITEDKIHSLPEYVKHVQELKQRDKLTKTVEIQKSEDDSGIDELIRKTTKYNNEVASKLLKMIQESEPTFFERLVIQLLSKMGYKGKNGSSIITPSTNDGGIDGMINQDPLGTNTVYIQAKRYSDGNVVQRPSIEGFYGALSRVHADRGVFITTSHFSKSAEETAKGFSIVLINGIQLTNLMLQYQVGVQIKQELNLFEIDEDFFDL